MIANPRSRHRVAIIPASDERVFEVKDSDKTSILIEPGIREDTTASPVIWIAAKFAAADKKRKFDCSKTVRSGWDQRRTHILSNCGSGLVTFSVEGCQPTYNDNRSYIVLLNSSAREGMNYL